MKFKIYILAFNEESNIERTLLNFKKLGVVENVTVLDSGSTDTTLDICYKLNVNVEVRAYKSHCETYNYLTNNDSYDFVLVFDADTYPDEEAWRSTEHFMSTASGERSAGAADVKWWHEGHYLKHGCLYPCKPFVFKTSHKPYFVEVGHAEKLDGLQHIKLHGFLNNDDRKRFNDVMTKQLRYIDKSFSIYDGRIAGISAKKDKIRFNSPAWVFISVLYSFFYKRAFLSGKVGLLYCLDRMIMELLYYRKGLLERMNKRVIENE